MKITVLEDLGVDATKMAELFRPFSEVGHEIEYFGNRCENVDELVSRCKGSEIVVLSNIPFPSSVIEQCPKLQLIAVAFTGVDHIDLKACHDRNIAVVNAAGYSTHSVAELTLGLILGLLRKIVGCDSRTRTGGTRTGLIGQELRGKSLGIIGTGAIGTQVARLALAFGCKVAAYSRTERPELKSLGVHYAPLDEVLRASDIICLHVPLTASTMKMIDNTAIQKMKPGSILVNCARGPVVDYSALAAALIEHRIAGAGIDVFETEPPLSPDHPLIAAPNVILTPHVAFATHEAFERRLEIVVNNIQKWMAGTPINQVL